MTKQEFVDQVADRAGLSKKDASDAVDAFLDTIESALRRGSEVSFRTGSKRLRQTSVLQHAIGRVPADNVGRHREVSFRHRAVPDLVATLARPGVIAVGIFEQPLQSAVEGAAHV